MAEQENKNVAEQNEQNENENEEKENKEMSEQNDKNEEKGKVKVKEKKEGFFKRTAKKFKKNRREILSALGGLAVGIGGTLGIEKIGEHFANKKMANAQDEQNTYYENNDDGTYDN